MRSSDPRPDDPDRLDELLSRFVESDYAPDGAEIEAGEPALHGGTRQGPGGEHGGGATVREFEHRGHGVRIATQYEVSIDGERWTGPIQVLPNGSVVSHVLPQYIVPSAVDLVRAVIDQTYEAPEEIRAVLRAAREEG